MAERELAILISAREVATAVFDKVANAADAVGGRIEGVGNKVGEISEEMMGAFEHPVDSIKALGSLIGEKLLGALEMIGPIGAGVAAGLAGVAAAAGAVAIGVFALASSAAHSGDEVKDFSEMTGIATGNVGKWEFAVKAAGGQLGDLSGMLKKIELNAAADDGGKFAAALGDIGINAATFRKMDSEQQLIAISQGFQRGSKSGNDMATAIAIMGKQGADSIPLLKNLTGELLEKGEQLGTQWSEENVNAADDFKVGLNTIETALGSVGEKIGVAVLPAMTELITGIADSPAFISVMTGAVDLLSHGIGYAVEIIGHLVAIVMDAMAPFVAIGTFITSLLISSIKGLAYGVSELIGWFMKFEFVQDVVHTVGDVFTWLKDKVVGAFTTIFGWLEKIPGIGPAIKQATDTAIAAFDGTKSAASSVASMTDRVGGSLLGMHEGATAAAGSINTVNRAHNQGVEAATDHSKAIDDTRKKINELSVSLLDAEKHHLSSVEVEKLHGSEIADLSLKARELGIAIPESITRAAGVISQGKLALAIADEMAKSTAEVAKGADQQASVAIGAFGKIGAKYKDLAPLTAEIQSQLTQVTLSGAAAQLAAIDDKVAKEKLKIGPTPDVYKAAYERATDAIEGQLKAQLAAVDAKEREETLKLRSKPDEYHDNYATATKLMKGELDLQRTNFRAKADDEKAKLGETPEIYREAWTEASDILDVQAGKQRDVVNLTYDTLEQRLRAAGVVNRAELITRADDEQKTLEQMKAYNAQYGEAVGYTDDAIIAQEQRVRDAQVATGNNWAILKTKLNDTLKTIPQTLASAFENGGDIMGAFKSIATQIGSEVGGMIGKSIGGPLGQSIGAAIGSLAGTVVGSIGNLFSKAGRESVEEFAASMGGFDALHTKLLTLGDAGEQYWIKLTQGTPRGNPEAAKATIDEITQALSANQAELDGMVPSWQDAIGLAEKYGGTTADLGPQFEQQELSAKAQALVVDLRKMQAAGGDLNGILGFMGDEFQDVLTQGLKYGQTLPEQMRPVLQAMVDQGKAVDENGNKLTDLSRINFAESIDDKFNTLIDTLMKFIDRLGNGVAAAADVAVGAVGSIAGAIADLPSSVDIDFNSHSNGPIGNTGVNVPAFADEAYVRSPTLAMIGDVAGGELVLRPSTVSRWLDMAATSGAAALGVGGGGGHTFNLDFHLPPGLDVAALEQWFRGGGFRQIAEGILDELPDAAYALGLR